jgi:Rrf2 family cysteine metabolism transcriptional repressor
MKISAKCDYACQAVLELTIASPTGELLRIADIAASQSISKKYLVQILIQLKRAGIVASTRAKSGGYRLARRADQITVGDVFRTIDGLLMLIECIEPEAKKTCKQAAVCAFRGLWKDLEQKISTQLDSVTFEDIRNRLRDSMEASMYDI